MQPNVDEFRQQIVKFNGYDSMLAVELPQVWHGVSVKEFYYSQMCDKTCWSLLLHVGPSRKEGSALSNLSAEWLPSL